MTHARCARLVVASLVLSSAASVTTTFDSYRAVFIWSPGHAGTVTLAMALRALEIPGVLVDFEQTPNHSPLSPCKPARCSRVLSDCARALDRWVRDEYEAWIVRRLQRAAAKVYVHVGHDAATAGVLPALLERLGARLALVRFERPAFDMAWSLSHQDQSGPCELWFGVCPSRSCAAFRPDPAQFDALSPFQKTLWMLDELGYQWRALRARARELGARSTEVLWSDSVNASAIGAVVDVVIMLLGRDAIHAKHGGYEDRIEVAHTNPHVRGERRANFTTWAAAQYAEYTQLIRRSQPPPPYYAAAPGGAVRLRLRPPRAQDWEDDRSFASLNAKKDAKRAMRFARLAAVLSAPLLVLGAGLAFRWFK